MHRARWMARGIYALKIYLFRSQFSLRPREQKALKRVCLFIVKIYLDAWYSAPLAAAAPRKDFNLLKSLEEYRTVDKEIAISAKAKLMRHLEYLGEQNVCLAFFDDGLSENIKRKMVQNLSRTMNSHKVVEQDDLSEYISERSLDFFDIMEIPTQFLLEKDPSEWETSENYKQAKDVCCSLAVVNDSAERAVALGQRYNDFGTKNENQKRAIVANIFSNRKKVKELSKKAIVDLCSSL